MSKRFGRNQRRKLREQLASVEYKSDLLETKASMQERSLQKAADEVAFLRQQLDNAKIVIGRNHPAFPAETLALGFLPAPRDRFSAPTGPRDIATMATMSITANRDVVFNEVHFRLIHGDVVSAYAVSEHAMRKVPEHILCEAITRELVGFTIQAYRKTRSGGAA